MRDRADIVRDRQLAIRREMDRRGILLKTIALDAEMSLSTVQSYFPNERDAVPAVMSTAALYCFVEKQALPVDLLSLLLPSGFLIVKAPEGIDHDEFAAGCQAYLQAKGAAHHPESEAGRELGPTETQHLDNKVVELRGSAAA